MEQLKNMLRVKPSTSSLMKEDVAIIIPKKVSPQEGIQNSIVFRDKRNSETVKDEIEDILEKLKTKSFVSKEISLETKKPKVKRVSLPSQFDDKEAATGNPFLLQEDEKETKERKTKRIVKGITELPPEVWVKLGDTEMISRLPTKREKVQYKMSQYYMNNREIFVNFINSLFQPYREEARDDSEDISCDSLRASHSKEFTLLTHQRLVRDYLNLYTPYRGLFLYHSLGSGKTATSIAIAEGMKDAKKIIVMTPASLEANYRVELKKFGDPMYKTNQCWEWFSTRSKPEAIDTLSAVLQLPVEYIKKKGGAWLVNVTKPTNCASGKRKSAKKGAKVEAEDIDGEIITERDTSGNALSQEEMDSLNEQIDHMIETKYEFIHYNGLRRDTLKRKTNNFKDNMFDNTVVIIDEAHNFISRIVNKIEKEKEIPMDKEGKRERVNISISLVLYEMLLRADNCKIVLLTGTPIVNYPNEIAILFNLLRGYIKTWEIPLDTTVSTQKVDKERLEQLFQRERGMDYIDYSSASKLLTVTRNPFGFETNNDKGGKYKGVSKTDERGILSDRAFESNILRILRENNITAVPSAMRIHMFKALPDRLEEFTKLFIEESEDKTVTMRIKNEEMFKRRIMGLTSYFRSAQEKLLPRYEKISDFHVIKIPMSDEQFAAYEGARVEERKQEKGSKGKSNTGGVFKEASSTYRIFSRLFCNFVMPKEIGRPMPKEEVVVQGAQEEEIEGGGGRKKKLVIGEEIVKGTEEGIEGEKEMEEEENKLEEEQKKQPKPRKKKQDILVTSAVPLAPSLAPAVSLAPPFQKVDKVSSLAPPFQKVDKVDKVDEDVEIEGDDIIEQMGDATYDKRIQKALQSLKASAATYLSPEGLETYSPKFLAILENIQDPDHAGLHMVYSQFRTMEGIGILKMVLEANGFAEFTIKKDSNGVWKIDIPQEKRGLPTFALYTGTESSEEKEILRKIYNGSWEELSPSLSHELLSIARNNQMGEVIKVFMITASGSEGINLRNTRYVHIMEPYWHPVRIEQVVGRARRICSHADLPKELQTVEVFLYLMTFRPEQINSDLSIELKKKDLSKREYASSASSTARKQKIPVTSDEALYEISTIKEDLNNQLIVAVKEASIDCSVYKKRGSKGENLHCLSFGDARSSAISFHPSIQKDQPDTMRKLNKTVIEQRDKEVVIHGKTYVYRQISPTIANVYDYDSYQDALETGQEPIQVGILETDTRGAIKFKRV